MQVSSGGSQNRGRKCLRIMFLSIDTICPSCVRGVGSNLNV